MVTDACQVTLIVSISIRLPADVSCEAVAVLDEELAQFDLVGEPVGRVSLCHMLPLRAAQSLRTLAAATRG